MKSVIKAQNVKAHNALGGLANHSNFSAICEFIDNSFDAMSQNIRVELRVGGDEGKQRAKDIEKEQTQKRRENIQDFRLVTRDCMMNLKKSIHSFHAIIYSKNVKFL